MAGVHVLTNMSAILNPDNIRPGLNLDELERQMIQGGLIKEKENIREPQDRFDEEMRRITGEIGLDEVDEEEPDEEPSHSSGNYSSHPVSNYGNYGSYDGSSSAPSGYGSYNDSYQSYSPSKSSSFQSPSNRPTQMPVYGGGSGSGYGYGSRNNGGSRSELAMVTMEQQRRRQIDNVVGGDKNNGTAGDFSLENENREDMKAAMLSEIDNLLTTLEDENVDVSRIPKVGPESEYSTVSNVLRTLRFKFDHVRGCSLAEEAILFGAYCLEDMFDGQRTFFGRYRPDLTGWHTHVNVKLKRMRTDTAQLVNNIMRDNPIGSGFRVLLELIPNMVLYSRMRKQQHGEPGLELSRYSDDEVSRANENLRNM